MSFRSTQMSLGNLPAPSAIVVDLITVYLGHFLVNTVQVHMIQSIFTITDCY